MLRSLLADGLDFHQPPGGQCAHLIGAACGVGSSLKEGGVDLVNGGEISDIREENGSFDHVIQSQSGCGQNRLDVFHSLRGLSLYAAVCKFTGGGVQTELATGEYKFTAVDGLISFLVYSSDDCQMSGTIIA